MATDSATALATQQSIKYYVDNETTSTITGATDTNITSPADGALLLYDTGTSTWRDNIVSGDATVLDTGALTIANSAVTLKRFHFLMKMIWLLTVIPR
jgi:phage baseplate assembly protein gpV